MKIAILADFPLHIIPEFGEEFRPTRHYATWFPQISNAWANTPGMEFHWIILCDRLTTARTIDWNHQFFHILPSRSRGRAATFFYANRKAIQKCLLQIQPAIVHGWGTEDVHALAAVLSGFPNIISMQGILSFYVLQSLMHPRNYFQAMLELYVFRKAGMITTESTWGRDIVLRRNPQAHVELVEYGVQNHFLEISWQPNPQKPTVIFIGTVEARKGIQDAVAAFRTSPLLASAELLILGNGGNWGEKLLAGVPSNIKWLGHCSADETARLLSKAWCLVLPTRADTSPNVVKEARVIGLPVVSTPCGGQTAYIQDKENGFLVEPGDIDALTKALEFLLSDFDRCRSMGEKHHAEHRKLLDPKRTAERFIELYHQVVPSLP